MDWKRWLVAANYYTTLPYRQWANAKACQEGVAPVIVLFYHRVADTYPNEWTISQDLFQRQVGWLQQSFEFVTLEEAQQCVQSGYNEQPIVSITFDDGYAENCDFALPWLMEQQIPFTYFVASEHVLSGIPFPHDVRRGQPLMPNRPDEIKDLADRGVEIGAHTRSHVDLGPIREMDVLQDEIFGSKHDLQGITGRDIRYFAFPYGQHENLSDLAYQLAREAGYQGVCSAYGGYNFPGDDSYHLQRIHADPEMTRFRNWLSVDRRKLVITERYETNQGGDTAMESV